MPVYLYQITRRHIQECEDFHSQYAMSSNYFLHSVIMLLNRYKHVLVLHNLHLAQYELSYPCRTGWYCLSTRSHGPIRTVDLRITIWKRHPVIWSKCANHQVTTFSHIHENDDIIAELSLLLNIPIAVLHPQSPCHFAWQPSAPVSQILQSTYLTHMIAAAT